MCAVAGTEGESAAARHAAESGIPAIDSPFEALHELMVVGPLLGLVRAKPGLRR